MWRALPSKWLLAESVILKNNNLHFEIIINPKAFSAAHDIAGISDVIAESAVSTICDTEWNLEMRLENSDS